MTYQLFFYSFLFLLGLIFGSFTNVLIYRVPKGLSLGGRSYCPKCKKQINWYDNIPLLSYIYLKGKCRYCNKHISIQYPFIELITGIVLVLVGWKILNSFLLDYNYISSLLLYLFLAVISIAISFIDIKYQIIPDKIVYFSIVFVSLILFNTSTPVLYEVIFRSLVAANVILFLNLITLGKGMGLGDVKLVLLLGLLVPLKMLPIYLYIAFLTGAVMGIILILGKRAKFGNTIPFGPFLILSFWILFFFSEKLEMIVSRYLYF